MKVSIIGAGNMARGIGSRVVAGGNELEVVARDSAAGGALAEELGGGVGSSPSGEAVVLAVPYGAVADVVAAHGAAATLSSGEVAGEPLDVLLAGDDADAKEKVASFVEAGGLRSRDVGALKRARQLEQLGFLHISAQEPMGSGWGSAIKINW